MDVGVPTQGLELPSEILDAESEVFIFSAELFIPEADFLLGLHFDQAIINWSGKEAI